jgi:hypothetical protein
MTQRLVFSERRMVFSIRYALIGVAPHRTPGTVRPRFQRLSLPGGSSS